MALLGRMNLSRVGKEGRKGARWRERGSVDRDMTRKNGRKMEWNGRGEGGELK